MRRGVSLVEILVVSLVVAAALIPIFGLFSDNARQVSFNADRAVAQLLAIQVIERYRSERFSDLAAWFATNETGKATIAADPILNELTIGIPEPMEQLYYKFQRDAVFVDQIPGVLGVLVVNVTWTSNQGQPYFLRHPTFIRNSEYHHGKP